ncbi:MAG: hypothetical protein ACTHWA_03075 [Arachnia sp.]
MRQRLIPPRQRAIAKPVAPVQPELLRFLSQRRMLFSTGILLAFGLLFLGLSMGRGTTFMTAMVLSYAFAVLSATVTGFTVWVRAQQHEQDGRPLMPETSTWSMWVGVGVATLAVAYLVVDVVANLSV